MHRWSNAFCTVTAIPRQTRRTPSSRHANRIGGMLDLDLVTWEQLKEYTHDQPSR
jgi:hypothetical protein